MEMLSVDLQHLTNFESEALRCHVVHLQGYICELLMKNQLLRQRLQESSADQQRVRSESN